MKPRDAVLGFAVFALAIAVFANSIGNGFVWDDVPVIRDNPFLAEPSAWWRCFQRDFGMEITRRPEGYYRPLVLLSFIANYAVGGRSPFIYHLTNVLLHALNTVLVFWLISRLAGRRVGALAAAVFAVHPIHSESVAFVAGRSDLLCTFFLLLTLLAVMRSLVGRPGARIGWLAAGLAAYAAALLSKEPAIALPAVLVGYALNHRYRLRNFLRFCAPTLLVALLYIGFRLWLFPPAGFENAGRLPGGGLAVRAARLIPFYAAQQVLPIMPTLGAHVLTIPAWVNLAAPMLLVLLLLAVRPRRWAADAVLWMVLFLMPAFWVNLFKGIEPSDRFAYAPSLGVCVLVALLAARYWERKPWAKFVAMLALIVLGATSFTYGRMWRNSEIFWRATVAYHPRCGRSYYNLGNTYWDMNNPTAAVRAYRKATRLLKDQETLFRAWANMARVLAESAPKGNDVDKLAMQSCRRALSIRPHRPSVRHLLARLLSRRGDHQGAIRELETALDDAPKSTALYLDLARESLAARPPRPDRAARLYRRALELGAARDGKIESAIGWKPERAAGP